MMKLPNLTEALGAKLAMFIGLATMGALLIAVVHGLVDRERAAATPATTGNANSANDGLLSITSTSTANAAAHQLSLGNPLWAMNPASLTATRERPLFSPSRRPPPPTANSVPDAQPARRQPSRPPMILLGIIAGESDGIAMLLDQTAKRVIRLKTGESRSGWTLRVIKGREAILEKNGEIAVLTLLPSFTR